MQHRINDLRALFTNSVQEKVTDHDFSFIKSQYGMFSIMGLSLDQVARLREEFSIYMVNNSRVNIAGISPANIEYLTDSIAAVL